MGTQMDNNTPDQNMLNQYNGEIDLRELLGVLWAGKIKIFVITSIFAAASVIYALSVPNQYKTSAVLSPAQSSGAGLSGGLGQLSGLASLAGVSLGGGDGSGQVAREIMKSWSFIEGFIQSNNLAVETYAAVGWDKVANKLLIDDDSYNSESNKWLLKEGSPSSWKLFQAFSDRVDISKVPGKNLVSVSVEHYSPHVAKKWLDLYVASINEYMQQREIAKVTRNIEYLEAQIKKTSIAEMQEVFYTIIEEQIKSKMLAEASPDYAFVVVSPSMIPEQKSQPKRSSMCILGTLLGGMFSGLLVLLMHYGRRIRQLN